MGRKKKEVIPLVVPDDGNGITKEGKNEEAPMEATLSATELEGIKQDAEVFAHECGFSGKLRISGPDVEKFPRFGFGYVLSIRELEGKQRMATAKYTNLGKRSFWMMEGMITG